MAFFERVLQSCFSRGEGGMLEFLQVPYHSKETLLGRGFSSALQTTVHFILPPKRAAEHSILQVQYLNPLLTTVSKSWSTELMLWLNFSGKRKKKFFFHCLAATFTFETLIGSKG